MKCVLARFAVAALRTSRREYRSGENVFLFSDIFSYLSLPPDEGLTLRIRSSTNLIYAYASVVRNDTGDAYTITGSGSE